MFDFHTDQAGDKPQLYDNVIEYAAALVTDEPDAIANMANLAALIWRSLPDLNWAGFYRRIGDALVLGPFIGKPACVRIAIGDGVCGTAAATGNTQIVADVLAFPGHIACDAQSRSELVVPVFREQKLIAVIDLDSPLPARFDADDAAGIERLARTIAHAV